MKPKPPFAVAQLWMNGVRTVNTFPDHNSATQYATLMAEMYKGNLVYLGTLVEQSILTDTEEGNHDS